MEVGGGSKVIAGDALRRKRLALGTGLPSEGMIFWKIDHSAGWAARDPELELFESEHFCAGGRVTEVL
jgi:hypothetical protein